MIQRLHNLKQSLLMIFLIAIFSIFFNNKQYINHINISIKIEKYASNKNLNNVEKIKYFYFKNRLLLSINNKLIDINKKYNKNTHNKLDLKISDITSNNDFVIIKTKDNKLITFNKKNLSCNNNINIPGKITSNIKLTNNLLYANINDHKLISINVNKNTILWETIINFSTFNITKKSNIVISNNKIYHIIPNKKLTILKKYTGEVLTSKNIQIKTSPLKKISINKNINKIQLYKNIIYICYSDGTFVSLNGSTGSRLWQKTKDNYKNFTINKEKIIITKKNGNLTALHYKIGKKLWTNKSLNDIQSISSLKKSNLSIITDKNNVIHILNNSTGIIIKSIKLNKSKINSIISKKNNLFIIKTNGEILKLNIKTQ